MAQKKSLASMARCLDFHVSYVLILYILMCDKADLYVYVYTCIRTCVYVKDFIEF